MYAFALPAYYVASSHLLHRRYVVLRFCKRFALLPKSVLTSGENDKLSIRICMEIFVTDHASSSFFTLPLSFFSFSFHLFHRFTPSVVT